ncbi:MAG TPA: MFS transporter, partial [Thermoanaerobaculia bacterium]|nr:MFS transporter [Thermoanaerobaculia bacterium]
PALAAYVTDIAPRARRGEYMGLTQMAMSLAFALGPLAGTAMLEKFGGRTLWLASFALGLLSTAMMLRLPEEATAGAVPTITPSPSGGAA